MKAEVFKFEEFAGSGKGLLAAPILVDNELAVLDDIDSISYRVIKLSDGSEVSGSIDLSAMKSTPQPWNRDSVGYTFLWNAPGTLWPDPNEKYRIIVTFNTVPALGGFSFIKIWQVSTVDPDTEQT